MAEIVCRIRRLKSMAAIGVADRHNRRTHFTKSADPERRHLNQVPIGGASLVEDVKDKLATVDGALRSNAVLAVEMVLSAAASWFEADPSRAAAFLERAVQQLVDRYGDRLVRIDWHMDETAPHIHAFIVPTEVKPSGKVKLNAKGMLGGPRKMHELQDWAGELCQPLGLERGKKRPSVLPENDEVGAPQPRRRHKSPRQYMAEAEQMHEASRRMLAQAERERQTLDEERAAFEQELAALRLQQTELSDLMARVLHLNEGMATLDVWVGEELGATVAFADASPEDVDRVYAEVVQLLRTEPTWETALCGSCEP
ncbi:MobV family relaxase [Paramagnetospirillum kuznetsovii]|nr:MobV family relaxase [Paramagnetospirillum kuznetsovii]